MVKTELGRELACVLTTVHAGEFGATPVTFAVQPEGRLPVAIPSKFSQTLGTPTQVLGEQTPEPEGVEPEGQVAPAMKVHPPNALQQALVATGQAPALQEVPRPWKREPLVQPAAEVSEQTPVFAQHAPVCGQVLGLQEMPLATLPEAQVATLTKTHAPVVVLQQAVTGVGQRPALQVVPTPWKKLGAAHALLAVREQVPLSAQQAPWPTWML